jgi:hypothetical protein
MVPKSSIILIPLQWAHNDHLTKTSTGFEGRIKIPWETKVIYKFIVDGQWSTSDEPTEPDDNGNLNNVYMSPPRPNSHDSSITELAQSTEFVLVAPMKDVVPQAIDDSVSNVKTNVMDRQEPDAVSPVGEQLQGSPSPISGTKTYGLSDIASTIAACEGAPSVMSYVVTGLGAVIQSVVGVDPINADKVCGFTDFLW